MCRRSIFSVMSPAHHAMLRSMPTRLDEAEFLGEGLGVGQSASLRACAAEAWMRSSFTLRGIARVKRICYKLLQVSHGANGLGVYVR